ncbi:chorismate-binding protein [Gramella sp. GC03-9]|uniref:Chorismate-binding protein n=1 Tax=Christiangramia oceanisediminis TaxID=2920386 RepID=A0A9X2KWR1_9FLAO|nr:chorismate-binding protein [Gramella oceanisediminis]MCP9199843.1 chorismate-binding protein [Gramella oceanisediminis]
MTQASEFYKKISEQLKAGKAFVAYSRPGDHLVNALLQNDKSVHQLIDLNESGFIFAPFKADGAAYIIPSEGSDFLEFDNKDAENIDSELFESLSLTTDFEMMEEDQKVHEKLVQKGIDRIKDGEFQKVVLARSEKVQVHDPDPLRIFKKLLNKYSEAFVYLWFHPETGTWLGATPETLLRSERNKFHTMALAGTQLYRGEENVEWGQKEAEEQAFVTDYIVDSLKNLKAVEELEVSEPYSSRAGSLLHIRTDISGKMNDPGDLEKVISTLHPTPAVCGMPKQEALQFILKNEEHDREFYSGYLGELNLKSTTHRSGNRRNQENRQFSAISKKTELFVNLRCMKLKEGQARIFIGGGITKDSNAADEWMETVNKSQTMKAVLVK